MPRRFKYIVIDNLYPVLFTEAMKHSDFCDAGPITSAGFGQLSHDNGELVVSCYGESVSLKLKSRGTEDSALIERMFVESF